MTVRLGRRLIPAALIALVAGSALGVVVAATNSATSPSVGMPQSLDVPEARLGDRGSYDVSLSGEWRPGPYAIGQPFRFLDFAWAEGTAARIGDGTVVQTDEVLTTGWDYNPWLYGLDLDGDGVDDHQAWFRHNETDHYLKGGHAWVAARDAGRSLESVQQPGPIGLAPALLASNGTLAVNRTGTYFPAGDDLCLLANDWQGTTVNTTRPQPFANSCYLHGLPFYSFALPLQAVRVEEVHGIQAVHLHGELDSHGWAQRLDVWMAPGLAYPLRLSVAGSVYIPGVDTQGHVGQAAATIDLVAFEAGQVARTPGPAPRDGLPELKMAPRQAWGPDDKGVEHPFPLSVAFLEARSQSREFADYIAQHPRAVVFSAYYFEGHYSSYADASRYYSWFMQVSDGQQVFLLQAMRGTETVAGVVPLGGPLGGDSFRSYGTWPDYTGFDPAMLPKELPTVASQFERWKAYAGPEWRGLAPNDWGFYMSCAMACKSAWVWLTAGHLDSEWTNSPGSLADLQVMAAEGRERFSLLGMARPNGGDAWRSTSFFEYQQVRTYRTEVVPGQAGGAIHPQSAAGVAAPLAPWLPTPAQAAGISILGLLAGAFYWLWPVLKGGAVGLFSRVRDPDLLEHPQRARIVAVVDSRPGIHFQELARQSGLPNGTLVHHLAKLTKAGLLVARQGAGYTCYFRSGSSRNEMAAAPVLKAEGARRILGVVTAQPGLTSQEVAERCGLQSSTVTYHVKRLVEGGLVHADRDGRFLRLRPAPLAITMAAAPPTAAA